MIETLQESETGTKLDALTLLFIFLFSFFFSHEAATWVSNDHLGKDYASLSDIHEIRVRTGAIKRGKKK